METVRELTREVRIQAKYDQLRSFKYLKEKESTELSLELCLD
jgi:lipoate synthase